MCDALSSVASIGLNPSCHSPNAGALRRYDDMQKDVEAKDARIKELENQLALGGSSAGDYEAPSLEPAAPAETASNPVATTNTGDGEVETL